MVLYEEEFDLEKALAHFSKLIKKKISTCVDRGGHGFYLVRVVDGSCYIARVSHKASGVTSIPRKLVFKNGFIDEGFKDLDFLTSKERKHLKKALEEFDLQS